MIDELPHDLPRDAAVADDDRGAEHRDRRATAAQQRLDPAPRPQVGREGFVVRAEPAEVDDLAHAGHRGRPTEGPGRLLVALGEVSAVQRVDEVVRDLDAVQCGFERPRVVHIRTDRRTRTAVLLRPTRHRAHVVTCLGQSGREPGADEPGCAGDEHGGHHPSLPTRDRS